MANDVRWPIPPCETIFSREDLNISIYVMQNHFSLYLLYSFCILKNLSPISFVPPLSNNSWMYVNHVCMYNHLNLSTVKSSRGIRFCFR